MTSSTSPTPSPTEPPSTPSPYQTPSSIPPIGSVGTIGWSAGWLVVTLAFVVGVVLVLHFTLGDRDEDGGRISLVMGSLIAIYVIGLCSLALLPLRAFQDWMLLAITAIMISLTAAVFGFILGLPRPQSPSQDSDAILQPGTNLVTISNSLTQYLTGAAFASLAAASGYVDAFGQLVQSSLTYGQGWGRLAGDMILVGYGSMGFLISYILTSTVGAVAFLKYDQKLLGKGKSEINWALPDVGASANAEQTALAQKIAALPFSSMKNAQQQLIWARAQVIVHAYGPARRAYAALYASSPNDPDVLIEFATALYNDPSFLDPSYILNIISDACKQIADTDSQRQSRLLALKAATYLYVPGRYVDSIEVVNDFIRKRLPPTKTMHFYRACGFGQLYRAYRDNNAFTLGDSTDKALSARIIADVSVTIGFGPDYLAEVVIVSEDPSSRPPDRVEDDDLQAFAADHSAYAAMVGLPGPPQQTDRKSPRQPLFVAQLPAPDAATYASDCPP